MITKERLEELIERRAKIWGIGKQGNIFCIGLKFTPQTLNNKKWLENKYEVYSRFFETKEEAEWHKEFGCIERTERLELPTWEEWKETCCFSFTSANGEPLVIEGLITFDFNDNDSEEYIGIADVRDYDHNMLFKELATKENYTLACRKAKELFLGDKENDR